MGGDDDGGAEPVQGRDQQHQPLGLFVVEIAGGLVGHQQFGAADTARAMATRCCSPPESSSGRLSSLAGKPDPVQHFGRLRRGSALRRGGRGAWAGPHCHRRRDERAGGNPGRRRRCAGAAGRPRAARCGRHGVRGCRCGRDLGCSARYISFSRLVLPAPDGPVSQRKPPSGMSKDMAEITSTAAAELLPSCRYFSQTSSNRIIQPTRSGSSRSILPALSAGFMP